MPVLVVDKCCPWSARGVWEGCGDGGGQDEAKEGREDIFFEVVLTSWYWGQWAAVGWPSWGCAPRLLHRQWRFSPPTAITRAREVNCKICVVFQVYPLVVRVVATQGQGRKNAHLTRTRAQERLDARIHSFVQQVLPL